MSSPAADAPGARPATLTPAVIILGADALLAARPAAPGQLINACYAAGYSVVIPASWGDELVAAGCLRDIAARGQGSVILCSCPRVAERLRRVRALLPQLLPLVAPPVAAARYLRARAGRHGVHITFVGDCAAGGDPAIDRHATPGALLRSLAKRGIDLRSQPTDVEERLLRDARRFYSLPGGAPAPNWLYVEKRGYTLVTPTARDFLAEVAYRISKRERRVLDLAPRLGCSCAGAVVGEPWTEARDKIAAVEPPRAVHEVLDHDVVIDLSASLEPWTGSADAGEPTVALSLEALATAYDPDTRGSVVRTLPIPPVPYRAARTSADRDLTVVAGPSQQTAPAVTPEEGDTPPEITRRRSGEPHTAPVVIAESAEQDLPTVHARPARPGYWAAALAVVIGAAVAAALVLYVRSKGPPGRPGTHDVPSVASGARQDTARPLSATTSAHDTSAAAPVASPGNPPSAGDSLSGDSAGPRELPAEPSALPRLPIGVAVVPGSRAPRNRRRHADTLLVRPFRSANPAAVAKPGAAPVPRVSGSSPQRSANGPPGTASGSKTVGAEAAALRAEIAQRRHRIDSLRNVLDSLGRGHP